MECLKCLCSCKGKDKKEAKTQQVADEQDRVRISNLRAFVGPVRQPAPEEEEEAKEGGVLESKAHAAKAQQAAKPKKHHPPEAKTFTFGRDSSPTRQPNSGENESAKRCAVNSGSGEAGEPSAIRTSSLSSSPYGFLPPPSVGVSPAAAASADANMDAAMNATGFDYSHNHNVYQAEWSVNGMTPIEQAQEASIIDSGLPSLHQGT